MAKSKEDEALEDLSDEDAELLWAIQELDEEKKNIIIAYIKNRC